ncbi:UNKNOWN [Stylonychia lemnae]|uniref:Morn repeat protein n=1 Tax=Stylonychia lemnae TaxID=5949 RepID=A0A078AEJ0_STYLE|nr:UNKNOWN [Stylonychia lemnae]|eukprot:CDW79882.1 UNKNOWN [Stylonychia lemnae]
MQTVQSQVDVTKFKCYRFQADGSIYYGEIMYLNTKTGGLVSSIDGVDEDTKKLHKLVRHGYGLQIFNGQRNADGVLTKYEGRWDRDRKQGENCTAVFKDGSIYTGSFKKDNFEGQGKFEWALGHIYEGQWKESQMEGQGEFKHANGRVHHGLFRRNYFLQDKCFINPLDDDKRQKKNIKVFEEQVLAQKEKIIYDKRIRLYHVSSQDQLEEAIRDTKQMNRVPLFKNGVADRVVNILHLPAEDSLCEINLRKIFSETIGNPIKKTEQREKLNLQIRKAIQKSQLILLNFDDYEYPDSVVESQDQLITNKDQETQHQQVFAVGYDPNFKEFSGTKGGLPIQIWNQIEISKRRELMECIGLISQEDDIIPDFTDNIHFVVWSNLKLKSKLAQKQILDQIVALQQDDMTKDVTAQTIQEAYQFDENQFNDTEILEKIEKRFGKALPLECINLILLKDIY